MAMLSLISLQQPVPTETGKTLTEELVKGKGN